MKKFILGILLLTVVKVNGQTGIPVPTMTQADNLIRNFMTNYQIPGLTFALAKDGKIVYNRAFGYQNLAKTVPTQPHTLFRIASCSKQITSIAIMKMMQEGQLSMNSKVFGSGGILENHPVYAATNITDTRIFNITVQQLLEHSAGWNRNLNCNPNPATPYPWAINGCDPITFPLRVTQQLGVSNPAKEEDLVKFLLIKGLDFAPGTAYNYSNIGYLILGSIIEKISGMSYENYVQASILHPLGIYDMHIGKNLLAEKFEREGEYFGGEGNTLSVYGDGSSLPWEYGGMNVNAMDGHGGWIATAKDMLTLLNAVDGFATKPDILNSATITTMVTPSVNYANYAKGWQVNASNNWWHTGAVPGTASLQVRAANGYSWVIIMNKRLNSNAFWTALDNLGWNVISATTTWPTFDLMLAPTQNSSALTFSNVTSNSIKVNWQNGNGDKRLLIVRPLNEVNNFPLDGVDYLANANFASAPALGLENKIVFNGSGNSVTVTGLEAGKKYFFRLVEYNNNAATGNNSLYVLGENEMASHTTEAVTPVKLISFNARLISDKVLLNWSTTNEINADHFAIERSIDGVSFIESGQVQANNGGNGNNYYAFTDDPNKTGINSIAYYYRLKMVDFDDSFTYSPVVFVKLNKQPAISVLPNPATNVLYITGTGLQKMEVLNMNGKKILIQYMGPSGGQIDISRLSAGVYMVKVFSDGGQISTNKIMIKK